MSWPPTGSPSWSYYRWLACPVTDAEWTEAHHADALFNAHRDDPEFGYRYLVEEARDAGRAMAERTGWRICSDNRWFSVFGKKHQGSNEGKLYLCAFKDDWSNRIVGYSIDSRMKSRLAVTALNNAVARRGDVAACVVHSDRG